MIKSSLFRSNRKSSYHLDSQPSGNAETRLKSIHESEKVNKYEVGDNLDIETDKLLDFEKTIKESSHIPVNYLTNKFKKYYGFIFQIYFNGAPDIGQHKLCLSKRYKQSCSYYLKK